MADERREAPTQSEPPKAQPRKDGKMSAQHYFQANNIALPTANAVRVKMGLRRFDEERSEAEFEKALREFSGANKGEGGK